MVVVDGWVGTYGEYGYIHTCTAVRCLEVLYLIVRAACDAGAVLQQDKTASATEAANMRALYNSEVSAWRADRRLCDGGLEVPLPMSRWTLHYYTNVVVVLHGTHNLTMTRTYYVNTRIWARLLLTICEINTTNYQ